MQANVYGHVHHAVALLWWQHSLPCFIWGCMLFLVQYALNSFYFSLIHIIYVMRYVGHECAVWIYNDFKCLLAWMFFCCC